MTGPPYPHPVPAAIGSFVIGVSPIGPVPAFDYWTTVISQYANSPILTQLITNFNQYIDQTANLNSFYDLIWNVDTAQGYGLDVWGRIVGVSRVLFVPTATPVFFGFYEARGQAIGTFGEGIFYEGQISSTRFTLTDSAFRLLIFAKALSNISDGTIPSINQLLLNLFPGRGNCFVTDGLDMTMTYTFQFALSPSELAIVEFSGVLPKPAGVALAVDVPG